MHLREQKLRGGSSRDGATNGSAVPLWLEERWERTMAPTIFHLLADEDGTGKREGEISMTGRCSENNKCSASV